MSYADANTCDETRPAGSLRSVLFKETEEVRSEECTWECSPRIGHKSRDRSVLMWSNKYGNDKEYCYEHTHNEHLFLIVKVLDTGLDKVVCESWARCENEWWECWKWSREYEDYNKSDEDIRHSCFEKCRHHLVVNDLAVWTSFDERSAAAVAFLSSTVKTYKTAHKVRTAGNNDSEECGNDRALSDSLFVLYSVELLHHLRESPCTERCKDNNSEEVERIRSEYRTESIGITLVVLDSVESVNSFGETVLLLDCEDNDSWYTYEHNNSLEEIIESSCLVAAECYINGWKYSHSYDYVDRAVLTEIEYHTKKSRQTVVYGSCVGYQEDEYDERGSHLERLGVISVLKEFRHCLCTEVVRHQTRTSAYQEERYQTSDNCVSNTYPCSRNAVHPAELSGITDENYRWKVGSTVWKGCQPRTYASSSEHKVLSWSCFSWGVETYAHHNYNVYGEDHECCDFGVHYISSFLISLQRWTCTALN